MISLWIESGVDVSLERGTLRLEREERLIRRVPVRMLEQVLIQGLARISAPALVALAEAGVPVVVAAARRLEVQACLTASGAQGVAIRHAQHALRLRPDLNLTMARQCLAARYTSMQWVARSLGLDWAPDATLDQAESLDSLMGIEGTWARKWYACLAARLAPRWGFTGRNRRPPRDPANALMSLSYTLAGSLVTAALAARGLDPGFGFLHHPRSGRASLALDVIEPLRALCDAWVVDCLERQLTPDHFTGAAANGCRLTRDGQQRFYPAWANWTQDIRRLPLDWENATLWPGTPIPADTVTLRDLVTHLVARFGDAIRVQARAAGIALDSEDDLYDTDSE